MTAPDADVDEAFASLPPSAKYVYYAIATSFDGRATRSEIIAETDLPERTVDEALKTLENCDYLFRARKSDDPRQVVCEIRESRTV